MCSCLLVKSVACNITGRAAGAISKRFVVVANKLAKDLQELTVRAINVDANGEEGNCYSAFLESLIKDGMNFYMGLVT